MEYSKKIYCIFPLAATIIIELGTIRMIRFFRKIKFEYKTKGIEGTSNMIFNNKSDILSSIQRSFFIFVILTLTSNFALFVNNQDILIKLNYEQVNNIKRENILSQNDNLLLEQYPFQELNDILNNMKKSNNVNNKMITSKDLINIAKLNFTSFKNKDKNMNINEVNDDFTEDKNYESLNLNKKDDDKK